MNPDQRARRKKIVSWVRNDDEDEDLRTVDLEAIVRRGARTVDQGWTILSSHPIKLKPTRYYMHLARVTMTLIEGELEARRRQKRTAADKRSNPMIGRFLGRWDAFVLTGPGKGLENEGFLVSWMIRSRLFLLKDYGSWIQNQEKAQELVPDTILVYDHAPAVMQYDLSACTEAMELLLASWREIQLNEKVIQYVRVLKARAVAYSCFALDDKRRLNRPDMVAAAANHVNLAFFRRCNHTFTSLEREIRAFWDVSAAATTTETSVWIGRETEAWDRVHKWALEILESPRGHSITDRFRTEILRWMVRAGEKTLFKERWPHKDPNPRNIVSRLRREDINRYGDLFLVRSAQVILDRDPKTDEDVPDYCVARNELIREIVRFMCDEDGNHRLSLVRPEEVCQGIWDRSRDCVLQIGGSFFVWDSGSKRLVHCGRRFYSALMEWIGRFDTPFFPDDDATAVAEAPDQEQPLQSAAAAADCWWTMVERPTTSILSQSNG